MKIERYKVVELNHQSWGVGLSQERMKRDRNCPDIEGHRKTDPWQLCISKFLFSFFLCTFEGDLASP
jgi:hypothetical protein